MKNFLRYLPLISLLGIARLSAQGGPPMITDDPGVPGDGHWEISTAVTTARREGERVTELPLVDINYGIGDRLQLKYEVAWLRRSDGTDTHAGLSNSLVGVKWRFYDAGEKAWSASLYPQLEFNNPGSHSDQRGLADQGTSFELPFQVMKDFGRFGFNADLGGVWHHGGGHEWFGGVAIGREFSHGIEVAVELHGEADSHFKKTALTANFGLRITLSGTHTLLVSLGRELHNGSEPRASLIAYLGLQTRF